MKKLLISTCVIFLAIFAFFFSNIKGYYRFKQYCEAEGGLRVYEPLERNVGWLAEDKYEARAAALLDGVGFVRYTDKNDGKSYDIKYIGGDPQDDSSFEIQLSNKLKLIVYEWKYLNGRLLGELRLGRYGYEISSVNSGKLLAQYYMFGYSKFDRSHTLLDAPSGVGCFDEKSGNDEPSRWRKELNTAFKN